jgi:hypothetical protein
MGRFLYLVGQVHGLGVYLYMEVFIKEALVCDVGMTIWVVQGQSHLSTDIPEITTASGRGGRFQPKGQLRQQPAGVFITRGLSR